jgi:PAS domain S-box-containing protein
MKPGDPARRDGDPEAPAAPASTPESELVTERARQALVLEASGLGTWELDVRTGASPRRSARHDRIFGYEEPLEDWSFERFLEHVLPEDREQVDRTFRTAVEAGTEWEFECRIHTVAGALRWIWARGMTHHGPDGAPALLLGVVGDVTERKLAEQALRASEARLRLALDLAELGTWEWDLRTGEGSLDERGGAIVGLRPGLLEEVAHAQRAAIHPDDLARVEAEIRARLDGGSPFDLEYRVLRPDGRIGYVHSRARVTRDDAGQPVRLWGTTRDVTAEREAQVRDAFLLRLADALRPLADPVEIQHQAARLLGTHLGASRVGYAVDRGDGETIEVTRNHTDGVPGVEGVYRYEDLGPDLLPELRAGRTVARPDVVPDPSLHEEEGAAHDALQLGATVSVPLLKEGRLRAVLFLHHREARPWSAAEVALLEEVAERTWAAVERARAEVALKESEERYRSLFDSIDEGFCVIEVLFGAAGEPTDYRFLEVNRAFETQTGLRDAEGRRMRELAPLHEEHWFQIYGRIARTGEPERFVQEAEQLAGRWYDVYAFRVGRPQECRVAVLFTDITEQRRAEEALREAKEIAEQASRSKSEFLAVMSHELRTPLNAIAGYTDLLEMEIHGPVTEAQRKALGRIQKSQQHLLGLINEVLNYARLESGAVTYEIADVPLREMLAATEALVEPQAQARGIALEVCECGPSAAVRADPEKLRQILLNLVSNAVKFTDPGGRIEIDCEVAGTWIDLRVRDTGIGIPADRLESIFEPFVQVRADLTRTADGTGLGLAISRDLARGMGGTLSVESTPGEGSAFTLRLRRAGPEQPME